MPSQANLEVSENASPVQDDANYIYRMSFKHWKTGKIIRSKNGRPFRFKR